AELLTPDEVYEFTIDLWVTANLFRAGHRLRVEISSSNFPRFDRNLNTGEPIGDDASPRVARQRVLHDAAHPSHILLPIIPRGQCLRRWPSSAVGGPAAPPVGLHEVPGLSASSSVQLYLVID